MRILSFFALAVLAAAPAFPQASAPSPDGQFQFFDNDGLPLAGGKVCTYAAGTTTPLVTYSDGLSTPNANPIVLDASGRGNIWFSPVAYKLIVHEAGSDGTCATGTIIYSKDLVSNAGQLLRADLASLAGGKGAALVAFEQAGGISSTVAAALGATPLATQYGSLALAVGAMAAGQTLTLPAGTYSVASAITLATNNLTLLCQPGAVIQPTSNIAPLTLTGSGQTIDGCTIDGRFSQSAYSSSCLVISGTNSVVKNSTIKNCGGFGVLLTGVRSASVHDSHFAGSAADAIFAQDNINGLETYGNTYDTTAAGAGAHCIGVHSTGTNSAANGVFGINIHDEIVTMGQPNPCIEVGYFGAGRPIPAWPAKISIWHMRGTVANSSANTFISLSNAQLYSIGDISLDLGGFNNGVITAVELAMANHGQVAGVTETGANATQAESVAINNSSDVDISGLDIQGQLQMIETTEASAGEPTSMTHVNFHDSVITLQPSFPQSSNFGPVWVQQNLPSTGSITDINLHDLTLNGVSTTDGNYGFVLENDQAGTVLDGVKIHHNTLKGIQYGFTNRTNSGAITNVDISSNTLGAGVSQCGTNCSFNASGQLNNFNQPQTGTGNMLGMISSQAAPGFAGTGAKPTCAVFSGAGGGATCSVAQGTQWHGLVAVTAGTSPVAGAIVVELTMPTAYLTIPYCTWSDGGNTADVTLLAFDRPDSTTTLATWANTAAGALVATNIYSIIYDCPLIPF